MLISWDYICRNKDCSSHQQIVNRVHKKTETEQKCELCDKPMERLIAAPHRHISWSLWKI